MKELWQCMACKWEGEVGEIRKEIVFHATREEPDEWEWYCPECNRSDSLEEKNYNYCVSCEDEIVKHEGDQCTECYTCQCEEAADAARGH